MDDGPTRIAIGELARRAGADGGLDVDPDLVARMRLARPDLPDDPSTEQVEAWIELAELLADPDVRRGIRAMSERGAADRAASGGPADRAVAQLVAERAEIAHDRFT